MRNSGNLLLASLSESDAAALRPHLKSVHLDHERVLFEAGGKARTSTFRQVPSSRLWRVFPLES
jgi:hypothetical protein